MRHHDRAPGLYLPRCTAPQLIHRAVACSPFGHLRSCKSPQLKAHLCCLQPLGQAALASQHVTTARAQGLCVQPVGQPSTGHPHPYSCRLSTQTREPLVAIGTHPLPSVLKHLGAAPYVVVDRRSAYPRHLRSCRCLLQLGTHSHAAAACSCPHMQRCATVLRSVHGAVAPNPTITIGAPTKSSRTVL